jgi:hypothetical protein
MAITTFAQNYSCSGVITDSFSGDSLAYVTVQVLRLQDSTLYAGAITNEQGSFLIQNLTKGDYLFRISCIGYQKKEINISIQEKRTLNLGRIEVELRKILSAMLSVFAWCCLNFTRGFSEHLKKRINQKILNICKLKKYCIFAA